MFGLGCAAVTRDPKPIFVQVWLNFTRLRETKLQKSLPTCMLQSLFSRNY